MGFPSRILLGQMLKWICCCPIQLSVTPWTAHQPSLPSTISQSLLKFMSIERVMPSNHLILCCPLLLLPLIFPSIRVFPMSQCFTSSSQSTRASGSVLPMSIQDWFPLGWTGWISLQFREFSRIFSKNCSSKASILWHSDFFMVQSHIHIWLLENHSFD